MINTFKLDEKITLCGIKENQEAMSILKDSTDYLILPSRFDGWGAVVNEALARGVKVITNEKCGASSMIKDDFWGIKYKEGNKQSLINVLERILTDNKKVSISKRLYLAQSYKIENQDKVVLNFIDKFN
jgi:glycosyltransferase involved in cell wall biosynthesis